jgi:putative transcriptional regulator
MPRHHPDEEQLLDYAAGGAAEPAGLMVATHLALCAECRTQMRQLEAIGGALLDSVPAEAPVAAAHAEGLARVLARLDEPEPAPTVAARDDAGFDDETRRLVPAPLRFYLDANLKDLRWRKVARGLDEHELALDRPGFKTRLLRIRAGAAIPRHGHRGLESVLVLDGGFTDEIGTYVRGDVGVSDAKIVHRPVADPDGDCLCLIVVEGRLRFSGLLGRVLSLFSRY